MFVTCLEAKYECHVLCSVLAGCPCLKTRRCPRSKQTINTMILSSTHPGFPRKKSNILILRAGSKTRSWENLDPLHHFYGHELPLDVRKTTWTRTAESRGTGESVAAVNRRFHILKRRTGNRKRSRKHSWSNSSAVAVGISFFYLSNCLFSILTFAQIICEYYYIDCA